MPDEFCGSRSDDDHSPFDGCCLYDWPLSPDSPFSQTDLRFVKDGEGFGVSRDAHMPFPITRYGARPPCTHHRDAGKARANRAGDARSSQSSYRHRQKLARRVRARMPARTSDSADAGTGLGVRQNLQEFSSAAALTDHPRAAVMRVLRGAESFCLSN
jgi:hypothetical protein